MTWSVVLMTRKLLEIFPCITVRVLRGQSAQKLKLVQRRSLIASQRARNRARIGGLRKQIVFVVVSNRPFDGFVVGDECFKATAVSNSGLCVWLAGWNAS